MQTIELWEVELFFRIFSFENGFWFPVSIRKEIPSPRGLKKTNPTITV